MPPNKHVPQLLYSLLLPSNRSLLGIERLTKLWYSVPQLQVGSVAGAPGAVGFTAWGARAARNKISSVTCEHGHIIMPTGHGMYTKHAHAPPTTIDVDQSKAGKHSLNNAI